MTRAKAKELDAQDELKGFKDQFLLPENTIYLDGNSLGPLPKATKNILLESIENEWANRLIRSWNESWLPAQELAAAKIAQLINAEPEEVIIADSVSVNLYKLAFASLKYLGEKSKVITDSLNFPSDLYILQNLIKASFPSSSIKVIEQNNLKEANHNVLKSISDGCLLSLSHVTYKDAFRYDVKGINEKLTKNNGLAIWDLSHSIGSVPINVKELKMQMAVGCTYKYLNGGPGAPAFLYIKKELQSQLQNPIAGWFSHQKPFDFDTNFTASATANNFLVGTPPILSLKGIASGVDLHLNATPEKIWNKATKLYDFFKELSKAKLEPLGFTFAKDLNESERGSHIALRHKDAFRINLSLINPVNKEKVFITDHRPPDIIRVAFTPLYQQFEDLVNFIERIENIMSSEEYKRHSKEKTGVI